MPNETGVFSAELDDPTALDQAGVNDPATMPGAVPTGEYGIYAQRNVDPAMVMMGVREIRDGQGMTLAKMRQDNRIMVVDPGTPHVKTIQRKPRPVSPDEQRAHAGLNTQQMRLAVSEQIRKTGSIGVTAEDAQTAFRVPVAARPVAGQPRPSGNTPRPPQGGSVAQQPKQASPARAEPLQIPGPTKEVLFILDPMAEPEQAQDPIPALYHDVTITEDSIALVFDKRCTLAKPWWPRKSPRQIGVMYTEAAGTRYFVVLVGSRISIDTKEVCMLDVISVSNIDSAAAPVDFSGELPPLSEADELAPRYGDPVNVGVLG